MVRFFMYVILTLLIIATSIFESLYIEKTFSFLEKELMKIEVLINSDKERIDTKENIDSLKSLHKKWHKKTISLKYLVWHTGIKDVEIGLSRITTYTQENDYTEAIVELNNLLDFSRHYSKDFKVLWENIF